MTPQAGAHLAGMAELPYRRGAILATTEDDLRKRQRAWRIIARRLRDHGPDGVLDFTGLTRALPAGAPEVPLDDELAPALLEDRLRTLALEHLGGAAPGHDVALFNRTTAALFAAHLALVRPGDVVVGVAPTYTHPAAVRAARQAGGRFLEVPAAQVGEALAAEDRVALVVLTRLAVTYDILPEEDLRRVVQAAHQRSVRVLLDDAGGARVGPAVFGQPKALELGADLAVTGLDKYGVLGPRLGLLAGEAALVGTVRARGIEFGLEARPLLYPGAVRSLEAYDPERVRSLVATTRRLADALRRRLEGRVYETPVTVQLRGEDVLEMATAQAGLREAPIVPYEATAALAMLLLEDYGILTVHLAAFPPGTSNLLFKFVPPETLERAGGPDAVAAAVASSVHRVAEFLRDEAALRALLGVGSGN